MSAAGTVTAAGLWPGAVRDAVDAEIAAFLDREAAAAPDPCLPPLVEVARTFTGGGKRIRPLFCAAGWLAAGGATGSPAIHRAGAALELFHTFALIHDDIMDNSDTRRGRPTVHRALGGGGRSGVSAAILLGDLCLVWSDRLLAAVPLPPGRIAAARPHLDAMRVEAVAGQYLDIDGTPELGDLDRAWRVVRHKTASYTVARPLQIGAALAGAREPLLRFCAAFGRPVGEAFQLRDDLLGAFGDPAATGKSSVDDFRGGKRTVLVALAWRQAGPAERRVLRAHYGRADLDAAGAAELRAAIRATGADTMTQDLIDRRIGHALDLLAAAPVPEPARPVLAALAGTATARTH
ncbi:polyprenyl synthetase family protein [Catenuloplanes atrovinosus]|uniref:Geranylgeranyl diphosphate synthase type I n=1 Tax=Catenuloplanes atrovinosus TaxID=137266 RepID=A0AAE4C991_9ACTN|nr:polyprenyl synthetase family protein [Catenuloplanes atrovinosus]MDR7275517.1 geranylgeranyl diphosphate synthase type I [Catenuloplanes atrovinosus]